MNVKYYYEFEGTDKVLNRVEMLCEAAVTPEEIKGGTSPFILEYPEVKKLEPVQSSGAKLNLISERVFRFLDLHTDDMQGYLIRFYRAGALYWIGYLDSELYTEDLSATPPYPVEFSAADFNILERLKFQDENEKRYTDITTLLTQVKRCFDRLNLPFLRLYIGCSTVVEDMAISAAETALHKLYVQSSNFYDEDGEPMSCREVIESILEPFGLVMVQRDACVYIYDYNTIKAGGVMKCYDFGTLAYQGDVAVPVALGDLSEIGFASTDATLGFEEMINNTVISCSPYMDTTVLKREVTESALSQLFLDSDQEGYTEKIYRECLEWYDATNFPSYVIYYDKESNNTIIGARANSPATAEGSNILFSFPLDKNYIISTNGEYYLNIKLRAYVNVKDNPFSKDEVEQDERARMLEIRGNLYLCDTQGNPLVYYTNYLSADGKHEAWLTRNNISANYNTFSLVFCGKTPLKGTILNTWVTNSNTRPSRRDMIHYPEEISDKFYGTGAYIPLKNVYDLTIPGDFVMGGILKFEITNVCTVCNPDRYFNLPDEEYNYPSEKIKEILINNLTIGIVDSNYKEIKNLDCEFKSYVNKKVSTDFEKKELKVTSCNEELTPIGKGCILAFRNNRYELQLKYTRGGQTDVLERLLFCSIHSNFTTKNRNISVDIKMTENPAMRYVTYNGILPSKGMLVKGCSLDFDTAVTRITAADFSEDTVKLSTLPYSE